MENIKSDNLSKRIDSCPFQIGSTVHRTKEQVDRLGCVVEIDQQSKRCRVLWDAMPGLGNYAKAKRTWVGFQYLDFGILSNEQQKSS